MNDFTPPELPSAGDAFVPPELPEPGQEAVQQAAELARARHASDQESVGGYIGRRSLPFVSEGVRTVESVQYGRARRRMEAGRPEGEDFDRVAEYEQLRENTAKRTESFGGALLESAAGMPAIVGEFAALGAAPAFR